LKAGFGPDRPNGRWCVSVSAAYSAKTRFSLQAGEFSLASRV
jgi:hypothetical protein